MPATDVELTQSMDDLENDDGNHNRNVEENESTQQLHVGILPTVDEQDDDIEYLLPPKKKEVVTPDDKKLNTMLALVCFK